MPNPFNPSTQIRFDLPQDGVAEIVVFNTLGQSIRLLRSTIMRAGSHDIRWDGLDNNGLAVGVGVYVVRLTTTTGARAIRVALVR
jgi:flagellar hook assembly protein FlgD